MTLQIPPQRRTCRARYEEAPFEDASKHGRLRLLGADVVKLEGAQRVRIARARDAEILLFDCN